MISRYTQLTIGLMLTALLTIPAAAGNGVGMNAEEAKELFAQPLQGKSPEQLARFFSHPNGAMCRHAQQSIVDQHGKAAVPVLEKLLRDTNPWMRHGAVTTLGAIYMPKKPRGRNQEPRESTPELERLTKMLAPLIDDKHHAVSQAVANVSIELGVETEATRKVAIEMAGNSDLMVRQRALAIGDTVITDPQTHISIGMKVSVFPNNIPKVWGGAHKLIAEHKDEEICRQALPTLGNFLLNIANTRPVRGMFSGEPQMSAMATIDAQWDAEVEQMENVVPGICCAFVRVPEGWMDARKAAHDLLMKMSPQAAPAIRKYAAEESKWLAEADAEMMNRFERDPAKARANFKLAVGYLDYIADCLESGEKITRECPIKLEEEKEFEDKVPDPGEIDLDNLLD